MADLNAQDLGTPTMPGTDPLAPPAANNNRPLTSPEKAAVIIALLGADRAGPVVEKIEDRHLRAFMSALENLQQIPRESMLAVVADFITQMNTRRSGFRGGPMAAKELAESLFEEERAARLFGAPPPPPAPKTPADVVWSTLRDKKVPEIAGYLKKQKPPVISIILSQFSTDKAGEILAELPEDISVSSVSEMSRDIPIDQRTLDAIAELIQIEFLASDGEEEAHSSIAFVSEVLGILPRERRDVMLETLEKSDPEQAEMIKRKMLTFEDLTSRLPTTAIPIIFRDFDQGKLLKVLKAGESQEPKVIEYFYANISQRMAGQFKEQVEEMSDLTQKEADGAISSLMGFISTLERQKRITLIRPAADAEA